MELFSLKDKKMKAKAQVSIEFLFDFLIALVYLFNVVEPGVKISIASMDDIYRVSQAKNSAERLANGINLLLASQGAGRQTMHIPVPEKAEIKCNPAGKAVELEIDLSQDLETVQKCLNRKCSSSIPTFSANFSCTGTFKGKKIFAVELEKNTNGIVNVR